MHLVSGLGLGGTEKAMQLLVRHLDRDRFEPCVFSFHDGPRRRELVQAGVRLKIFGHPLRFIEQMRPHVAHLHRAGVREREPLRTLVLCGVPAIVETNVFGKYDPSELGEEIDRHLFVSRFCLDRYVEALGIAPDPQRYGVLYNPIETAQYADCGQNRDFSRPVAGRVSRPDPRKWSRLAFDFLPHILREFPDFRFEVIGATEEFVSFVTAQGWLDHVGLHPLVDSDRDLAGFLDGLSVFAHANDTGESFGMAIAEAMAAGLPVVTHPAASDMDNAQLELVEDGVTGLVARTAEEYAQAVGWLFRHPGRAAAMGRAGRDKACRLYDAAVVTRQLEDIYLELTNRSQG